MSPPHVHTIRKMVALADEFGDSHAVWRAPSDCSVRHNGATCHAVHSVAGSRQESSFRNRDRGPAIADDSEWSAFARSAARKSLARLLLCQLARVQDDPARAQRQKVRRQLEVATDQSTSIDRWAIAPQVSSRVRSRPRRRRSPCSAGSCNTVRNAPVSVSAFPSGTR